MVPACMYKLTLLIYKYGDFHAVEERNKNHILNATADYFHMVKFIVSVCTGVLISIHNYMAPAFTISESEITK